MNAVRFLFCIYNFIFLIIGGSLLGAGIWISTDSSFSGKMKELIDSIGNTDGQETLINLVAHGGYVLIGFGSLIFLLSFLGYCGAIKESRFLLGFYTALLTIIFILEIIAVVLALTVFGPRLEEETRKVLVKTIDDKYRTRQDGEADGKSDGFPGILNEFMKDFHCCGINNGADFVVYSGQVQGVKVPKYCCVKYQVLIEAQNCQREPTSVNSYFDTGCYHKLKEELLSDGRKMVILIVGVVIGLIQLLGIIFAIFTFNKAYS